MRTSNSLVSSFPVNIFRYISNVFTQYTPEFTPLPALPVSKSLSGRAWQVPWHSRHGLSLVCLRILQLCVQLSSDRAEFRLVLVQRWTVWTVWLFGILLGCLMLFDVV